MFTRSDDDARRVGLRLLRVSLLLLRVASVVSLGQTARVVLDLDLAKSDLCLQPVVERYGLSVQCAKCAKEDGKHDAASKRNAFVIHATPQSDECAGQQTDERVEGDNAVCLPVKRIGELMNDARIVGCLAHGLPLRDARTARSSVRARTLAHHVTTGQKNGDKLLRRVA